jgi:hypothetical protein
MPPSSAAPAAWDETPLRHEVQPFVEEIIPALRERRGALAPAAESYLLARLPEGHLATARGAEGFAQLAALVHQGALEVRRLPLAQPRFVGQLPNALLEACLPLLLAGRARVVPRGVQLLTDQGAKALARLVIGEQRAEHLFGTAVRISPLRGLGCLQLRHCSRYGRWRLAGRG